MQEVLPSLMHVVSQPVRPVAQHLFTPQEKANLASMVAVLVAYALTIDLGQHGQPALLEGTCFAAPHLTPLAPAVHSLCSFPVSSQARMQHVQCNGQALLQLKFPTLQKSLQAAAYQLWVTMPLPSFNKIHQRILDTSC